MQTISQCNKKRSHKLLDQDNSSSSSRGVAYTGEQSERQKRQRTSMLKATSILRAAEQSTWSRLRAAEQSTLSPLSVGQDSFNTIYAEMEEAKNQEIAKLCPFLREITEYRVKEEGVADIEIWKLPQPEDIPITGNEAIDKLTSENVKLKYAVSSLQWKFDESHKQATDAESMVIELKTSMQSLQEKLSDMETEEQILRQQVMMHPSNAASKKEHDNKHMAYWLSTTSTLLYLLYKSLSPTGNKASHSPSFFGRMAQELINRTCSLSFTILFLNPLRGTIRNVAVQVEMGTSQQSPCVIFKKIEQIGTGNFSHVFKVLKRIDGCMYAMKRSMRKLYQDTDRQKALMEVQSFSSYW